MKKICILGGSILQLPIIKQAAQLGIYTIVIDYDKDCLGNQLVDKFYCESTLDFEAVFHIAENEKIDGIVTICSDRPMPIIARIGECLKLNTISYQAACNTTNKSIMRQTLQKNKVPIPKFFVCKNFNDFLKASENFKEAFIVKPSDNSGSRGVVLANQNSNFKEIYAYAHKYSSNNEILVEEYMLGNEISAEVFVTNKEPQVLQLTDKITTGPPHFIEAGHFQPSYIEGNLKDEVIKISINAVKSLNIERGPAHVEIIITESGPRIVEVGARLGGDHITTDLVPLSTGINMVDMLIKDTLGDSPIYLAKKKDYSGIIYFNGPYDIEYELKQCKTITEYDCSNLHFASEDKLLSSNDRYGFAIFHSDKKELIKNEMNKILEATYL